MVQGLGLKATKYHTLLHATKLSHQNPIPMIEASISWSFSPHGRALNPKLSKP